MQQKQTTPLAQARVTTRDLMALLADENEALTTQRIETVGQNIQDKQRLALKLEKALQDVKASRTGEALATEARDTVQALQADMDEFQALARKNILLLKSAHQVRADTLAMIRDAVTALKPKAETYNKTGQVNDKGAQTSLLDKTI